MREILFRGKRTDNGEWVYGDVRHDYDGVPDCISDYCGSNPVVPETVGQYTGLTDKNGEKIFEGDIAKADGAVYVCCWNDCNYEFEFDNGAENFGIVYAQEIEIIGNIHDDPELLKGGVQE